MFKKAELRLLWPFYLKSGFFTVFMFFYAFSIPYFLEQGFSVFQVGLALSAVLLAKLLFEIPTGAIADIFGRKNSTIIGLLLSALSTVIIFYTGSFWSVLFSLFLLGFAETFISGAEESWVVDSLPKKMVQTFYMKNHSLMSMSMFISGFLGSFLVLKFGLNIIWISSAVGFFLAAILYMFIPEKYKPHKLHIKKDFKTFFRHTKDAGKFSFTHNNLKLLMIAMFFIGFYVMFVGDIAWFPFLNELGFKAHWYGYLFSATVFMGIFVPMFIGKLLKKVGSYKKYLISVLIIMLIILLIVPLIRKLIFGILAFFFFMTLWDFYHPAKQPFFQSFIPKKLRATITSMSHQIRALCGIIAQPLVGLLVDNFGARIVIFSGIIFLVPIIWLYSKLKE